MHEYRDDGWPLCPECNEDELMSGEVPAAPTDALLCLRCGWRGTVPVARWRKLHRYKDESLVEIEVYPIDDTRGHWLSGPCWCDPKSENVTCEDTGKVVVMRSHNAADGRELTENAGAN